MKKAVLLCLSLLAVLPAYAQEANLLDVCVSDYDAAVDYFPAKVTPEEAVGFTVEYHDTYKVVDVLTPFAGATDTDAFRYLLVQCGTPVPTDVEADLVIEIPTQRVVALSTTFLPHLVALDKLDTLVGIDSFLYAQTPEVLALIADGDITEVGSGSEINLETTILTQPDMVFANASGSPEYDAYPVLLDAGIPTVISGDYVETTPLGRAEWLKFTAVFLNAEARANEAYDDIKTDYNDLVALTADLPADERPTVLWGSFNTYGSAWYIPGSDSFVARLLDDAGMNHIFAESPDVQGLTSSVPFDFESGFAVGRDAQIWIPESYGVSSLDDLLAQDERYAEFSAFQSGEVYTNGVQVNVNGGNAYYETGVLYPNLILRDLIHIAHPDLIKAPFTYFLKLK